MSIAQWIEKWAETDRVAFHFEGEATTYAEFNARITRTAQGLLAHGVRPGDRVVFVGLNRLEVFDVLFGCARIGAIFVPLNNRLTSIELGEQIEDSDPAWLLATDGFDRVLGIAAPDRAIRSLDDQPFVASSAELPADVDARETTVLMLYTSGTTGRSKAAMLSSDAMLYTVLNGADHQQLTGDDRVIAPLPTFHVGGLNIQTLPTLFAGGQVLLQRRFDPADLIDLVVEHKATQTLLVPAMLGAVASQPGFDDADLSSLRGINSGSSVVSDELMQPFFDRDIPVGQVYGATETGPTAVVLSYDDAETQAGSCGLPALHTELRIVDDQGNDVAVGVDGELWVRGPNLFSGYWNNTEATEAAFARGGWYRTGDIGSRDEDGYVYISDRLRDMIISGGENIYPAEVEPVLLMHPLVDEVAVIGHADEAWGEVPVAVVVLADDAELTIDELRSWCDGRLARFKHPRILRQVEELPRTALGKVMKHELRDSHAGAPVTGL